MDTKEIVALTEKWLNEIKQITVSYNTSVAQLEKARQEYEMQKKKWYIAILPYFLPLISFIVLMVIFVITIQFVGCPNPIHLNFQNIQITQTCTK